MARYETLFLAIPELTQDEFSSLESFVHKTISNAQGTMLSCERWGKYRLAYPVRRNDYGIYGLIRFDTDPAKKKALLDELHTVMSVKYNDIVMRSMTTALDENQTLAYHRPESLEETPARDVDTFLKENKMEGLMSKKPAPVSVEEEESEELDIPELEDTDQFMGPTAASSQEVS